MFAIVGDFFVLEGIQAIVVTIIALLVGSSPDACGRCRNCWLYVLSESVKDGAK